MCLSSLLVFYVDYMIKMDRSLLAQVKTYCGQKIYTVLNLLKIPSKLAFSNKDHSDHYKGFRIMDQVHIQAMKDQVLAALSLLLVKLVNWGLPLGLPLEHYFLALAQVQTQVLREIPLEGRFKICILREMAFQGHVAGSPIVSIFEEFSFMVRTYIFK